MKHNYLIELILAIWNSPRLFNYVIMVMYLCSATRWFFHYHKTADDMSYAHGCYWLAALAITAVVTFLYKN